jgi:phosphoglycerate kinase
MTKYFKQCAAGLLMEKEIEYLGNALLKPERPFVAIIGGAKVSSKIDVLTNLVEKCDSILLGGAMVYTFMKADGLKTGSSLVEDDKIDLAKNIVQLSEEKKASLELPSDHLIADKIECGAEVKTVTNEDGIDDGWIGVDIGQSTINDYIDIIKEAKTIVWNGPLGVFEIEEFSQGTKKIANAVADSKAISIIGGGDSAAAAKAAGVEERITHISTGGGASLDFLAGKALPGVEALSNK